MSTCSVCNEKIPKSTDAVTCSGVCAQAFHFHCAGFSEKSFRAVKSKGKKYICLKCLPTNLPKSKSTDQKETSADSSDQDIDPEVQTDLESSNLSKSSLPELDKVNPRFLENPYEDLKSFITSKFSEFTESLNYHANIVKEITTSLKELKAENTNLTKMQTKMEAENVQLKADLSQVKCELIELQQYTRRTNVEISGLPELENEDIKTTVRSVFHHLKLENLESITAMHRVPTNRKDNHKPIIIQFANKAERDHCLHKAKQSRFLASDINPRFSTSPVFINEHLAPAVKRLFYLCKTFKNEKGFKFCWIKEGKIFLRQEEHTRVYRIQKESDLLNVTVAET